ncbi:MAG: hypothetical protein A2Y33_03280 [Spirochaetes bacterium GWF1_51_8]|nr:MAG: hypothetical protein A2Y33_03280 [Spirochaetes bacterium GWF1_51_8]
MFKKCISSGLVVLFLNASVFSAAHASIFNIFATSGNSSAQSSGNSSGNASGDSSITIVIGAVVLAAAIGLAIWGISTSCSPAQPQATPQVEVSILIDEAARMNGHNLDMLSKIYDLDCQTVANVIMEGVLGDQVSAFSQESAILSKDYLSKALLKKSVEVNGGEPKIISALKNDPEKIRKLMDAIADQKTPGEIFSMVFAF